MRERRRRTRGRQILVTRGCRFTSEVLAQLKEKRLIPQRLINISALAVLLVASALAGCGKHAEQATKAEDRISAGGAGANDMKLNADMNMLAGEGLHANFAHKELVVLNHPSEVPAAFTNSLGAMYKQYVEMATALGSNDVKAADAAGKRMSMTVESLQPTGLDAEAKAAWASHREVMRTSLHQLTSARDIERKREHFSHLSEAMYCALKSFGGLGRPVYVVSCPMGFGGHGAYWLADEREISNPYRGSTMTQCGEIKETIN